MTKMEKLYFIREGGIQEKEYQITKDDHLTKHAIVVQRLSLKCLRVMMTDQQLIDEANHWLKIVESQLGSEDTALILCKKLVLALEQNQIYNLPTDNMLIAGRDKLNEYVSVLRKPVDDQWQLALEVYVAMINAGRIGDEREI